MGERDLPQGLPFVGAAAGVLPDLPGILGDTLSFVCSQSWIATQRWQLSCMETSRGWLKLKPRAVSMLKWWFYLPVDFRFPCHVKLEHFKKDKNLTVLQQIHLTFLVLSGFPLRIAGNYCYRLNIEYTPPHPLSFMDNHSKSPLWNTVFLCNSISKIGNSVSLISVEQAPIFMLSERNSIATHRRLIHGYFSTWSSTAFQEF